MRLVEIEISLSVSNTLMAKIDKEAIINNEELLNKREIIIHSGLTIPGHT